MPFLSPKNIKYTERGLDAKQVSASRREYGANSLTRVKREGFFVKYLHSFGDPMIKILLIALALNFLIALKNAEFYEPMGIAIALFLATFVSTLSEYGSESAFLRLEAESSGACYRVRRDGEIKLIPSDGIVVGDTVYIDTGERVPADGVIIHGRVSTDTSALTGESKECERCKAPLPDTWDINNRGLLFRGCVITSGECVMTVGRVGDATFLGGVAREVQAPSDVSPLTRRLARLARTIGIIGYIAAALVFFSDLFNKLVIDNGFERTAIIDSLTSPSVVTTLLHALTLAITVVVVAVPEGLPMMITVVLSSNMKRLKRDNVLVRRLVGIETAGCINILFCDKTGTLTEGRLSVACVYGADARPCPLTRDMAIALGVNNGAKMVAKKAVGGNATDRALLSYVKKPPDVFVSKALPFDSNTKYSAIKTGDTWYIKGAPEVLFNKNFCTPLCNLHKKLTCEGMRVLAMAKARGRDDVEILGLVAIRDKLRSTAKKAVTMAKDAGIRVCMITGDNLQTARCIASECGILGADSVVTDHAGLERLDDSELISVLPRLAVVARALPSDKSRLTRLAKQGGLVCAMTGDGINDAPALKNADVGFSMGGGTEVAKEASDIVILDNSFLSITKAILYGRTIFKSIRRFLVFQLTINLCAVGVSVIGPFIGIDTPVTVMQMLWINMIMDTLAGLAFAGEPPDMRYMRERPLTLSTPVLDGRMAMQIAIMGIHSLVVCVLFLSLNFMNLHGDEFLAAFFALFVFQGLFAGICARSQDSINIFRNISKNRAFLLIFAFIAAVQTALVYLGGELFRTVPLSPAVIVRILLLCALVIPADLLFKILLKKFSKKAS